MRRTYSARKLDSGSIEVGVTTRSARRSGTRSAKKAFTLVELLVVIAIIGVLVSLLMPALSKARQSAQRVACMSNLRQVGVAFMLYETGNEGYLPSGMTHPTAVNPVWPHPGGWYGIQWNEKILPYLGVKMRYDFNGAPPRELKVPLLVCPFDSYGGTLSWDTTARCSYMYNRGQDAFPFRMRRASMIKSHFRGSRSDFVILADNFHWGTQRVNNVGWSGNTLPSNYFGDTMVDRNFWPNDHRLKRVERNALFLDGHVETMSDLRTFSNVFQRAFNHYVNW